MAQQRPLLIPWLRAQIDSNRYPGVVWTNEEKTQFSIPWKHALRQDSSDYDVLIFKAWAEVSGNGRAQGDASVWKRNFRSALRAKGFTLVSDNRNDSANPHKVYQWPEEGQSGGCSSAGSQDQEEPDWSAPLSYPTQESQEAQIHDGRVCFAVDAIYVEQESTSSEREHDILQECLKELNIGPHADDIPTFEPSPEQQQQILGVTSGHALPEQQQYPVAFQGAAGAVGLPEQQQYPVAFQCAAGAVGLPEQQQYPVAFQGAAGAVALPEQQQYPVAFQGAAGAAGAAALPQQPVEATHQQFINTMSRTMDGDNFKTHFRVLVYYRGVKVSDQLVENEAGFRLVYRPEFSSPVFDPNTGLSLVSLPNPETCVTDATQLKLTQRILEKLDSVEVGVSSRVVYGQRCGDTKAFWSFDKFDGSKMPREVSKWQPEPLYHFNHFLQGIMDFIEGKGSPPCSLYVFLGEKWPCPDTKPWEKKLIMVEVVMTSLELLKGIAVEGGASSLQSVELQISLQEMMDTN